MADNLPELFTLTPENLARRQAAAYCQHLLGVLERATARVQQAKRSLSKTSKEAIPEIGVSDITFDSPAGDDHGRDDCCLDFSVPGMPAPLAHVHGFGDAAKALNRLIKQANGG